jgi:peroxiredoxin
VKYLKHALIALAIIVAGLTIRHFAWGPTPALSSEALYAANFPDNEGNMQAIEQWRGKIMVINFWATWCPPCREEMPELSRFHEHYRDKGVLVLGIATDDVTKIREFTQQTKVSYPLLAGDMDAMNLGNALGNNKGILPYTVIVDRDGSVVKTYFGRVNHITLEEVLLPLLATSTSP